MHIIVEDTNIFIDLFNTGLYQLCIKLGVEFHTTRFVIAEIKDEWQRTLLMGMVNNRQLLLDDFSGAEYMRLVEFIDECRDENNLSEADCSVLLLAKRLGCRLLTSDQKLIRKAEADGIGVNGFLWLTDLMVENHAVTHESMREYLERYLMTNPRAPEHEVRRRIRAYQDITSGK